MRWVKLGWITLLHAGKLKVRQQESFIHHIQIGRELNKPVIVQPGYPRRYAGNSARRKVTDWW